MHVAAARALFLLIGAVSCANAWEEEYRGCIKACSFRMPGEKWDDAKRDWAKACRETCEAKLPPEVRNQRAERMERAKAAQARRAPPTVGGGAQHAGGGHAPHRDAAPPAPAPARFSPVKIPANTFKANANQAAEGSKDWTRHHLECIKACMPERRMGEVWDEARKSQAKKCQESCSDRIPESVRQQRAQKMKEAGVTPKPAAAAPAVQPPAPFSSHKVSQDSSGWRKRHLECIRACMPEARKGEMWGESERAQAKLCRESCSEQLPDDAQARKGPKSVGAAPQAAARAHPWASDNRPEDADWKREHLDCIKACMPVAAAGKPLDATKRNQAKACQESCNNKIPEEQRAKAKKIRQDPRLARQMQDSLRKSTHRFMENMAPADGPSSTANATGARGPPAAWVKRHSECITACMPAKEKGQQWDEGEQAQAKLCRDSCDEFIPEQVRAERAALEEVQSMEL